MIRAGYSSYSSDVMFSSYFTNLFISINCVEGTEFGEGNEKDKSFSMSTAHCVYALLIAMLWKNHDQTIQSRKIDLVGYLLNFHHHFYHYTQIH